MKVVKMPGPSEMKEIFRKANAGEKLAPHEERALDDASQVAGYGYGADARRAKDAYDERH